MHLNIQCDLILTGRVAMALVVAGWFCMAGGSTVVRGVADTRAETTAEPRDVDSEAKKSQDGEGTDTNTPAFGLFLLKGDDAATLGRDVDDAVLQPGNQSAMEAVVRTSVPLVLMEEEGRLRLPVPSNGARSGAVTLSTPRIRQAFDLYDRALGRKKRKSPLHGTDVNLRFDPDEGQGYLLQKVEVGFGGQSLWVVHELLAEQQFATSIQLRVKW